MLRWIRPIGSEEANFLSRDDQGYAEHHCQDPNAISAPLLVPVYHLLSIGQDQSPLSFNFSL